MPQNLSKEISDIQASISLKVSPIYTRQMELVWKSYLLYDELLCQKFPDMDESGRTEIAAQLTTALMSIPE